VREIRLSGNTVFSDEELGAITTPYENREITSEELEALRQQLSLYYVERGYINSGALVPDQEVVDGVVRIEIVEGRLTEIEVEGNETLSSGYVSERFALGAGPPLNVNDLQERMQLLLETPFIERINGELRPGNRPGEAKLRARVAEYPPYQLSFTLDNQVSPSLGEVHGVVSGSLHNLLGRGDIVTAEAGFADGLREFTFGYAVPITARDTTFSVLGERSRSRIVEEPVADLLDIESEFGSIGFRVSHPIRRTVGEQIVLSAGLDRRHSQTFLKFPGLPPEFQPGGTSFSPGVELDGESDVTVVRLIQEWFRRSRTQAIAARSTLSFGVDALGATIHGKPDITCAGTALATRRCPDGEFFTWLGQFQWARRFGDSGIEALLRFDTQLTNDPLLPLEQYSLGGMHSVRGYREDQIVRDFGYSASLELRIPLSIFADEGEPTTLRLTPFFDVGGAWNNNRPTPDPRSIAAPGVGLRWDPHRKLHAELYWAHALDDEDIFNPSESVQDSGIHFLITTTLFD
jgi:hemolysin activation/secretion protein